MEQPHYISTLSRYKKNNARWRLSLRIIKYCVRKTPLIGGKGNDDLNGTTNSNHTYIVNDDTGDDTCHRSDSKLIFNMGIENQSSLTPLISLLKNKLKTGMTPTLAKYLSDNFTAVTHKETSDAVESGFDATVWKDVGGKTYVSMTGSQPAGLLADMEIAA